MTVSQAAQDEDRVALTRAWGDRWASLLWEQHLAALDIAWQGSTVLDFGCGWGYLSKLLVEQAGVGAAHGVDLYPMWEAMIDGFHPDDVQRVHLHCGDVRELPALARLRFDTIVSIDTVHLLTPTDLMGTLLWFFDHLKPGGSCVLQVRPYTHRNGADIAERTHSYAHLLFSVHEVNAYLEEKGLPAMRYVNPSCAATYLAQLARAGFTIVRVERKQESLDEAFFAEHETKLRWLDRDELCTSELLVHVRRPVTPDLSVLDHNVEGT